MSSANEQDRARRWLIASLNHDERAFQEPGGARDDEVSLAAEFAAVREAAGRRAFERTREACAKQARVSFTQRGRLTDVEDDLRRITFAQVMEPR